MNESVKYSPLSVRLLSTFELNDEILTKLKSKGFTLKSEILYLSDSKLKSICDLTESEVKQINELVRNSHKSALKCKSLSQLLDTRYNPIHTGCYSLDRAMNGGLQNSKITQISAEGGAGKTQICMQCCVNAQLPPKYGGVSGQVLYIDTEGSLRIERITSMAKHRLESHPDLMPSLSARKIISQIHVINCMTNSNELIEIVVNRVMPFLDENPEIRLLVIDSIAQHFRFDYKGTDAQKDYELALIAQKLREIASLKKVAVLLTNQVTFNTKVRKSVPALGKYWQHNCNITVFIKRMDPLSVRIGRLTKSNETEPDRGFYFEIIDTGIKEVMPSNEGDPWHPNY